MYNTFMMQIVTQCAPEVKDPFEGYYSTETVWLGQRVGGLYVSWICKFCCKQPKTMYINGGSHRDYTHSTCNCEGAARTGTPWYNLN